MVSKKLLRKLSMIQKSHFWGLSFGRDKYGHRITRKQVSDMFGAAE